MFFIFLCFELKTSGALAGYRFATGLVGVRGGVLSCLTEQMKAEMNLAAFTIYAACTLHVPAEVRATVDLTVSCTAS